MWVWPKSASRAPASFAAPGKRGQIALDAVEMAVGHKNAHAVKLQRQALRDCRGVITVAGHIIEIRFLTGEGQILRIGQMVAQMHNRVRVFFSMASYAKPRLRCVSDKIRSFISFTFMRGAHMIRKNRVE